MTRYAVLLTLIICALVPALAPAETITVPGDYPTIQEAVEAAYEFDSQSTIIVSPGTYEGWTNVWGTCLPNIVSIDPDDPAIVASTIIIGGFYVGYSGTHPPSIVRISGLTFENGGVHFDAACECYTTIVISNNVFHNASVSIVQTEAETIWIIDNTFSWATIQEGPYNDLDLNVVGNTFSDCFVGMRGHFNDVIGNTIVNSIECGAELKAVDEFAYNYVANNEGTGVSVGGFGYLGTHRIHNNTIVGNDIGLLLWQGSVADSNTIVANRQAGVVLGDDNEQILRNSIIYGNGVAVEDPAGLGVISYCCSNVSLPGEGNIVCDPRFVDPAAGDYHLTEWSPCINRGTPDYDWQTSTVDSDDDLRVMVDRIDIGADETPYNTPRLAGDLNGDGTIDGLDIQLLVEAVLGV